MEILPNSWRNNLVPCHWFKTDGLINLSAMYKTPGYILQAPGPTFHRDDWVLQRRTRSYFCLVVGCGLNGPITCTQCRVRSKSGVTKSCCPHQCAAPRCTANSKLQNCELLGSLNYFFLPYAHSQDWVVMLKQKEAACYVAEPELIYPALSNSTSIRRQPFSVISIHGKNIRLYMTYSHLLAFYKRHLLT